MKLALLSVALGPRLVTWIADGPQLEAIGNSAANAWLANGALALLASHSAADEFAESARWDMLFGRLLRRAIPSSR